MRPDDLLFWLRAQPFRPFRITLASGQTCDVRHSELVRVGRTHFLLFTPTNQLEIHDHVEMVGLLLIERIEPIEQAAAAG